MRQCAYCGKDISPKRKYCDRPCYFKHKRGPVKDDYFSSPNMTNSYWAGFIAADGCIYDPEEGQKQLSIILKSDDKSHLAKIAKEIAPESNIQTYRRAARDKRAETEESRWRVSSDQIALDLSEHYNVGSRKSMTLKPPAGLSKECSLAYIAGYIDGDGSYFLNKGKPRISIVGTREILDYIVSETEIHPYYECYGTYHRAVYTAKKAQDLRNLYIDMDLPFLDRKYKIWEKKGYVAI